MDVPVAANARTGPGASARGTLVIVVTTAVIILAVAYLSDRRDTTAADGTVTAVTVTGAASGAAPAVGERAPDFIALTSDGTRVKLSDFIGRPVWLTFGATWCQPCRAENPDIQAIYEKMAGSVEVIQVYLSEDAATVNDYTNRVGLTYLRVPDPSERLAAEYRILGIPSHFFIDSTGVLRQIRIGSLDPTSMEAAIAEIGD